MEKIVDIKRYRHRQRKAYLAKHGARLDHFIERFVTAHFNVDFTFVSEIYQAERLQQDEMAWDYDHLREVLESAITETFGDQLYLELSKQFWFEDRWISREEVMDRCISVFVLGQTAPAAGC